MCYQVVVISMEVPQLTPGSLSSPPSCCAREGMETKQKAVGQDSISDNMLKIPGLVLRPCYLIGSWELAGGAGEITNSCHLFWNKSG